MAQKTALPIRRRVGDRCHPKRGEGRAPTRFLIRRIRDESWHRSHLINTGF